MNEPPLHDVSFIDYERMNYLITTSGLGLAAEEVISARGELVIDITYKGNLVGQVFHEGNGAIRAQQFTHLSPSGKKRIEYFLSQFPEVRAIAAT